MFRSGHECILNSRAIEKWNINEDGAPGSALVLVRA